MLTGMLAAEERVKNAVMPLSRRHRSTSGYGLRRVVSATISGLPTKAMNSIAPTSTHSTCR